MAEQAWRYRYGTGKVHRKGTKVFAVMGQATACSNYLSDMDPVPLSEVKVTDLCKICWRL